VVRPGLTFWVPAWLWHVRFRSFHFWGQCPSCPSPRLLRPPWPSTHLPLWGTETKQGQQQNREDEFDSSVQEKGIFLTTEWILFLTLFCIKNLWTKCTRTGATTPTLLPSSGYKQAEAVLSLLNPCHYKKAGQVHENSDSGLLNTQVIASSWNPWTGTGSKPWKPSEEASYLFLLILYSS